MDGFLLKLSLSAAVPLKIADYEAQGGPFAYDLERARRYAQDVGTRGDMLMFGDGNKGEAAELFNKVVDGAAVLAFMPGGVTLFDMHFEATLALNLNMGEESRWSH